MTIIESIEETWNVNRSMTLRLLDSIETRPDAAAILGWRPGPERAHIAWQLMHIGITEEVYGIERLAGKESELTELIPRFKGGSTPDDSIPPITEIRETLETGRQHLLEVVHGFSTSDLETILPAFVERNWPTERVLRMLAWHEAHHQGQAHITLNLYMANHAG